MTSRSELRNIATKDFMRRLVALRKRGGPDALAADRMLRAFRSARQFLPLGLDPVEGLPGPTQGVFRRVTDDHLACAIESDKVRLWIWIGPADQAREWGSQQGQFRLVRHSDGVVTPENLDMSTDLATSAEWRGMDGDRDDLPLFDAVSPEQLERVALPPDLAGLVARVTMPTLPEAQAYLATNDVGHDETLVRTLGRVLNALAGGRTRLAEALLDTLAGRASIGDHVIEDLADSDVVERSREEMVPISDLSESDLEHYFRPDRFSDWLVFLHPEQSEIARKRYAGAARITGVSGSGKTVILVHRARELALRHPDGRVLVVTLNRALARLLKILVGRVCTGEERTRIDVDAVYDVCQRLLKGIGKDPGEVRLFDPVGNEHVELHSWRDFREHALTMKAHHKLIATMTTLVVPRPKADQAWYGAMECKDEWERLVREGRQDEVFTSRHYVRRFGRSGTDLFKRILDATWRYLRDEILWIRSAFPLIERAAYLSAPRQNRSVPLQPPHRERILKVLRDWEEYMRTGHLLDPAGVSLLAREHLQSVERRNELRYRCVLADEAQDLSTNELRVINALVTHSEDGLFLVGDAAQQVYAKASSLTAAGISITGRATVIRKNYRNTREVLHAARALPERWPPPSGSDALGFQLLDPELSARRGPPPEFVKHATDEAQLKWVGQRLTEATRKYPGDPLCVVSPLQESRKRISARLGELGLSTQRLEDADVSRSGIYVANLEDVKGFEFPLVVLCDLSDQVIPDLGVPHDEWWREACHVYVAMTRARDEIAISCVGNPSPFVGAIRSRVSRTK